ncbi:MAG: calcium-transporting P-type ATPase, PMR1-type [Firmicutes bacterium]|nr:calcium-transporting P-type ATPase, PMR1-type [Bacillota bacterium]
MKQQTWSHLPFREVCRLLQTDFINGLSSPEARKRLQQNGHNLLAKKEHVSPLVLLLMQFKDFMVLVLLGATLLSAVLGEYTDALVIIIIVLVNAILGFIQEYRAERSLEALQGLAAPQARVLRDGIRHEVPAQELVPGDIVIIEAGDRIPADLRLGEVRNLSVNEAALTGESEPVRKNTAVLEESSKNLGDQINMAYMGTMAVGGRGSGVVVATGMQTQMGRIAHLIQDAGGEETPLQKRLEQMGKYLVMICLFVCGLVVLLGLIQGLPAYRMFLAGVSLAVAAIPEGLPAVVTMALAIGVQRMVRRNAIVRRLPAVETLGCATVICSDKTGTLTQNKMNVQKIWTGDKVYEVVGEGYAPHGRFLSDRQTVNPKQDTALLMTLKAAVLCNNARLQRGKLEIKPLWRGHREEWQIQGDPTEGALLVAGARAGLWREDLERQAKRLQELPFDGTRKRMSVLYNESKESILYVKGAPEIILERCTKIFLNGRVENLTYELREKIARQNETMAALALRNLAVAYRPVKQTREELEELESELIFLGILGMIDPPRPEVLPAIKKCQAAGIKTVMITGDHKTTAVAIARTLRLLPHDGNVLTGSMLDELTDRQLQKAVLNTYVYARVTPEHKLRIVRALKLNGQVVAMTGDGVNDAPAVKEADIGVAMGESGTDVTREAAALVLADDNFATIVSAVEEGRGIYDNIRKFIRFLLACNIGEILTMFLAMLVSLPVPLRAIQILWINLVTDGLPAMALGIDPVDPEVMTRPPRDPQESIFAHGLWEKILGRGVLIGIICVLVFAWSLHQGAPLEEAQTLVFASLIMAQLIYVFDCRSERKNLWQVNIFTNLWLVAAVLSSLGLLLLVLYHPLLTAVFYTVPLTVKHWLIVAVASFSPTFCNLIVGVLKAIIFPRFVVVKK